VESLLRKPPSPIRQSTWFTFCPECGSTVFYVEEGDEQEIAIPVGAFADSHFPTPTVSVYEKRRHPWVSLPKDVERWRKDPL
jgi:hypothetical protein